MTERKFRLVTRSDFDGLICAVLLKELNLIEEIKFVHPKELLTKLQQRLAKMASLKLPTMILRPIYRM